MSSLGTVLSESSLTENRPVSGMLHGGDVLHGHKGVRPLSVFSCGFCQS